MSRRRKQHRHELPGLIKRYATSRKFEHRKLNEYAYRIVDDGFAAIDIFTTGKYFIVKTSYEKVSGRQIGERTGERGILPKDKTELGRFLDRVFYWADILEAKK